MSFYEGYLFEFAGLPNSCGLVTLKDRIAPIDAEIVLRMKAAGAIPLGVTTVPELSMWWETSNNIHGTTKNPYDSRRIVGGSSGSANLTWSKVIEQYSGTQP